jgi:hypothetical protein
MVMAKTVFVKVLKQTHIFQKDLILEVCADILPGNRDDVPASYSVPDVGNGLPGTLPVDAVKKVRQPLEESGSHFGKCVLTKVSNFYKDPARDEREGIAANGIVNPEKVRVIHYPDCQQIVFHMPKAAYDAGQYQLIDNVTNEILEDLEVRDRLNGSTMMLINTLLYKPGFYTIEASWPDGWTHQIRFIKFIEGFPNVKSTNISPNVRLAIKGEECHLQSSYTPEPASIQLPRDPETGFLAPRSFTSSSIRKQVVSTPVVSTPVVTYTQEGRGGKIYYRDAGILIEFDWEFAGGNAVILFSIPEEKHWEAITKTPLSRREEILKFVANRVIADQAPGCRFEIYSNSISIVR